jgi:hypothetical protein
VGCDRSAWFRLARNGAVILALAGALAVPFFERTPHSVPPDVATWARDWLQTEAKTALVPQGYVLRALGFGGLSGRVGPQTWPFYVITYLGLLPAALLVLGLAVCWRRHRGAATVLATALLCVHLILFTGGLTGLLPLWPSFYPTRIGIWLAPAVAVALAGLGSLAATYVGRRTLGAAGIMWLGLFAVEGRRLSAHRFGIAYYESAKAGHPSAARILVNEAAGGAFWIATFCRDNSPVTPDDLRAFGWIREHTPLDAVFATNYADGGNLIAAVAHRPVINPHFENAMFYQRELEEWHRRTRVDYIYVSSEVSPAYSRTYTAEALDKDPSVELAFRAGEAHVYKVKRPRPL